MGRRHGGAKHGGSSPAMQRAQAAMVACATTSGSGGGLPSGLTILEASTLQSLWAGYGEVIEATSSTDEDEQQLIIIKEVAPPPGSGVSHTRKLRSYKVGSWAVWDTQGCVLWLLRLDRQGGLAMKMSRPFEPTHPPTHPRPPSHIIPQVEAAFYEGVVPRLPPGTACHVPRCLGVHSSLSSEDGSCGGGMQLVLSDLRPDFPCR